MSKQNKGGVVPRKLTQQERNERGYKDKRRDILIGRARASVVRKQLIEACEILENVRFDFVADTAFREKVVSAKRGIESAISDFLLDDSYWKEKKEHYQNLSVEEYIAEKNNNSLPTQGI